MKVGLTLKDYYKDYLQEIANLNNMSITSVCGLIVENFLSFNKRQKRFPLFQRQVNIVFENEKSIQNNSNNSDSSISDNSLDSNSQRVLSKEEILQRLKDGQVKDVDLHDDDWLPF